MNQGEPFIRYILKISATLYGRGHIFTATPLSICGRTFAARPWAGLTYMCCKWSRAELFLLPKCFSNSSCLNWMGGIIFADLRPFRVSMPSFILSMRRSSPEADVSGDNPKANFSRFIMPSFIGEADAAEEDSSKSGIDAFIHAL